MVQGKKILVTGGGGYFGHKLGNELKKLGAVVVLFDISWPLDDVVYQQMECFQGDITSKEDVRKIFISHQIDVVFHSASYGMSGREQLRREQIEKVNIPGTKNVIEGKLFDFELFVNSLQTNNTILNENVYTSTYNVVFEGQVIRNRDEILCHIYC
ncbi:unnamed protein product [Pocillopora meandrina]|uniref:3-beta hydroxysteroid dehydrogenase/isomerase domain-containing protein n=1 Tax=Pocillopora meandrina TaxID=46732 RepID=A0AAU9VVT7_9CNID|nr:unnamed protein product [Pocillopora meandrina]